MRKKAQAYIEKMRSRPRHEQQRHAVGIATVVTAAIFFIWLPLFVMNFQTQGSGDVAQAERSDVRLFRQGVASVGTGFKEGWNALRGKASDYSNVKYTRSTNENTPYGPPLVPVTEDYSIHE